MSKPVEEICPICKISFIAGSKYRPSGKGVVKTCPNGHATSEALLRIQRSYLTGFRAGAEAMREVAAKALEKQHTLALPEPPK